jgi:hypothetical protein
MNLVKLDDSSVAVELPREECSEYSQKKKVISLPIEDSSYTSDELAAKVGVTKRNI